MQTSGYQTTRVFSYLVDENGDTGAFLAHGSLIAANLVGLHARVSEQESPPSAVPRSGPSVRSLVVDAGGLEVIDGEGLSEDGDPDSPVTAVLLGADSAAQVVPVPWPPLPATDEENRRAYAEYIAEAARDDPEWSPYPTPRRPPVPNPDGLPPFGRRPPWCSMWPGGPGCR